MLRRETVTRYIGQNIVVANKDVLDDSNKIRHRAALQHTCCQRSVNPVGRSVCVRIGVPNFDAGGIYAKKIKRGPILVGLLFSNRLWSKQAVETCGIFYNYTLDKRPQHPDIVGTRQVPSTSNC